MTLPTYTGTLAPAHRQLIAGIGDQWAAAAVIGQLTETLREQFVSQLRRDQVQYQLGRRLWFALAGQIRVELGDRLGERLRGQLSGGPAVRVRVIRTAPTPWPWPPLRRGCGMPSASRQKLDRAHSRRCRRSLCHYANMCIFGDRKPAALP